VVTLISVPARTLVSPVTGKSLPLRLRTTGGCAGAPAPPAVGDPMKFTTQGKEYATWVKVKGQWLYKTRQIASGSNPPEGWK